MIVLNLALAIVIIDGTILNVSVRQITADVKTDVKNFQWIITIYSLVIASLTILGGKLGDLFGKKKMFLIGATIFAIGSAISGISQNFWQILLGWSIVEGIGASLMMPATTSLIISNFKGKDRAIAFGVWGGIAGASSAIGPLLGGYLTDNISWRWAFLINVLIVLIILIFSFTIKEEKEISKKKKIDIFGAILSGTGLLFIIFGIIESSKYGFLIKKENFSIGNLEINLGKLSIVPIFIFLGIFILINFYFFEKRRETKKLDTIVSTKIFENKSFVFGVATSSIISLGQSGIIFSIPVFLQSVRNYSAFQTGIALLPLSIAVLIISPLSIFIGKKISIKNIISIGLIINFLSTIILSQTLSENSTTQDLMLGLSMLGAGMGLTMSRITNFTISSVNEEKSGEASGLNNTFRQIGSSLGSAIIGAVFISSTTNSLKINIKENEKISSYAKEEILKKIENSNESLQFSELESFEINESKMNKLPENIQNLILKESKSEMKKIREKSVVSGNRSSLLTGSLFTFFAILISRFLPNEKTQKETNLQKSDTEKNK